MKILVITSHYPPPSEGDCALRCQSMVQALSERSHEVNVLTGCETHPSQTDVDEPGVFRELCLGDSPHDCVEGMGPGERMKKNKATLKQTLEKVAPDVVHVWNLGGLSNAFLMQLQHLKIPVVYDVSSPWLIQMLDRDRLTGWWHRPKNKKRLARHRMAKRKGGTRFLNQLSRNLVSKRFHWENIYFCSAFLKNQMLECGHDVGHAPVIQSFFDVTGFAPKKQYGKTQKLLWVGDFSDEHDPMTALEAFRLLCKRGNSEATLHLYYRGEEQSASGIRTYIEQLRLGKRVSVEKLEAEQERTLYSEHDGLIFTSVCGDPFPLIPLHAMAARLPVIVARDGGAPELVKDEFNGLTFKPRDHQGLLNRIDKLLAMNAMGSVLGKNGYDFVTRSLKKDEVVGQIEETLLQAAALRAE